MSGPARTSVQDQLMRMAMVIITVSIVLSCAGSLYLTLKSDRKSLDSNLLNSAYILAETPLVRNALTGQAPQEELAAFLERATDVPTIDLILVADTKTSCITRRSPSWSERFTPARPRCGRWRGLPRTPLTRPALWALTTLPTPRYGVRTVPRQDMWWWAYIPEAWRRPWLPQSCAFLPSAC